MNNKQTSEQEKCSIWISHSNEKIWHWIILE